MSKTKFCYYVNKEFNIVNHINGIVPRFKGMIIMAVDSGIPDVQKMSKERNIEGLIKALEYRAFERKKWEAAAAVRENAAIALGEIGDIRAVKPLIKALAELQYGSHSIDYRARDALCKIGKPSVDSLIIALGCDPDEKVRYHAAKCLGKICDNSAVEPLINALLYDKSHSVRYHAAEALGNIGDMRAFIPLKKAVSDRDSLVHDWAEWALNKLRRF